MRDSIITYELFSISLELNIVFFIVAIFLHYFMRIVYQVYILFSMYPESSSILYIRDVQTELQQLC